jgi:sugar O-acyltransferase (sialic acid O-acetyltransferase NeuD family)
MAAKIGLIGYGSVGKQLFNTLLECGYDREMILIFDDHIDLNESKNHFRFADYPLDRFSDVHFIPTLGYISKKIKLDVLVELRRLGRTLFTFIHPTAFVSKNAKIGGGVIIYPLCNIDQGVVIGDGTVILNSSIVAHDSRIAECCYLAPGVCMSGFVEVEKLCFIGSGASITNNVRMGENSTVAIGTCVTKNVDNDSFVIGNPMRVKNDLKLI